jgi:hypothetical protein
MLNGFLLAELVHREHSEHAPSLTHLLDDVRIKTTDSQLQKLKGF